MIVFTWAIQVQCIMQILVNRLCLIMYNPARERRLRFGLLIAIGIINVSVFIIWVPARMGLNQTFVEVNRVWDRTEKAIFATIDLALNIYFMRLVKSKLVASGLAQYNLVYKYNIAMVCISISLDVGLPANQPANYLTNTPLQVLIIAIMSLPDDAVYIQVHCLTFLTKLNIEMNMASLLGKVVKRSTQKNRADPSGSLDPSMSANAWQLRPPRVDVDFASDDLHDGGLQWPSSVEDPMLLPAPPPSMVSCHDGGGGQLQGRDLEASFGGSTAAGTVTGAGSSSSTGSGRVRNGDVGGNSGRERGEGGGGVCLGRVSGALGVEG